MTADYTIEATPGQVAAIERDGFLVVAGPRTECKNGLHAYTDEPVQEYHCPACDRPPYRSKDGDWYCFDPKGESECRWRGPNPDLRWCCSPVPTTKPCGLCCGQGHVLKFKGGGVLTPCPTCNGDGTISIVVDVVVPERACPCVGMSGDDCAACPGTIPARTLLRGTAEAVPVVVDVTHHFADVPRPEVGDTAWIIRGEGT